MVKLTITEQQTKEAQGFEAIPPGEYPAAIISTESKPTRKNPNNVGLEITWEVIDGPHKGRRLRDFQNCWHENDQTSAIAQQTVARIVDACGLTSINDTNELIGRPAMIKVACGEYNGRVTNEVKGYKKRGATHMVAQPDPTDNSGYSEPIKSEPDDGSSPWKVG